MNADKLLEKLGWKLWYNNWDNDVFVGEMCYANARLNSAIYFQKDGEFVELSVGIPLTPKLIEAIQLKMKELGWIK